MCGLVSAARKDWKRVLERVSVGTNDEITKQVNLGFAEKRWTALAGSEFLDYGILITTLSTMR